MSTHITPDNARRDGYLGEWAHRAYRPTDPAGIPPAQPWDLWFTVPAGARLVGVAA